MKVKSYKVTCNACPHQAEGELEDGRWFYFRARHELWSVSVADALVDAVCGDPVAQGVDPHGYLSYGDAPDEARALVEAVCVFVQKRVF
jgi:hypothetical protein